MPDKSHDFAALAKRISTWTSNSLLTLMVLVAGVGFGRQVLKWWAADASPIAVITNRLGDSSQPHTFQFGDNSWLLRRQMVPGDKKMAVEQLRAACREVLEAGPTTTTPVDDRFLAFLAGSAPVAQEPDKWRLYELQETLPMAVGVLANPSRMAVWGLAVPAGDKQWTLSTFQSEVSFKKHSGLSDVPLPPGGHRTLSLSAATDKIITFSGSDRPADWKRFYDNWFACQGWKQSSWQPISGAWYAKFTQRDDSVEIRFGPDGHDGLSGLLMTTTHELR